MIKIRKVTFENMRLEASLPSKAKWEPRADRLAPVVIMDSSLTNMIDKRLDQLVQELKEI